VAFLNIAAFEKDVSNSKLRWALKHQATLNTEDNFLYIRLKYLSQSLKSRQLNPVGSLRSCFKTSMSIFMENKVHFAVQSLQSIKETIRDVLVCPTTKKMKLTPRNTFLLQIRQDSPNTMLFLFCPGHCP
jgi:hypothetical protein